MAQTGNTFDAGTVYAEAHLDRDPMQRDIKAAKKDLAEFAKGKYSALTGLDLKGLKNDIATAKRLASDWAKNVYKAGVGLQTTRLKSDIRTAEVILRDFASKTYSIKARLDLTGLKNDIRQAKLLIREGLAGPWKATVNIGLNQNDLIRIRNSLRSIAKEWEVKLKLTGATTIIAELERIRSRLRDISTGTYNIRIRIDIDGNAELIALLILLQRLRNAGSQNHNIRVNSNSAVSGLMRLVTTVLAASGALIGLVGTAAALGPALSILASAAAAAAGAIGLIPAAITAAGGAFAAIKIGISGVGDAFSALSDQQDASGASAASAATAQAAASARIKTAVQGVEDAERSRYRTARDGSRAVQEAMRNEGRVADQNRRALTAAARDVADAREAASERIKAAERSLDDATVAGRERVASAEDRVASANRRRQDTQEALTRAIRDAKEANEDLALSLKSGEISVEEAGQSLRRAQERLNNMPADATGLDWEEARTAVKRANQSLIEAKERYEDLQQESADAAAKGVEGADNVVRAKRDEEDAIKDVSSAEAELKKTRTDSSTAIADAEAALNKARTEGNRQVADAEERLNQTRQDGKIAAEDAAMAVTRAREQEKEANDDAARSVIRAQEALAAAYEKTGDTASAAANKANLAMSKLSANAQDFVKRVRAMAPAWDDVKRSVQDALFKGAGEGLQNLSKVQLPGVERGLVKIATGFNRAWLNTMKWLSEAKQVDQVNRLLDTSADTTSIWAATLKPILDIFLDIADAGAPILRTISNEFYLATDRAAKFVDKARETGDLGRWIQSGVDQLKLWIDLIGNVGGILYEVLHAADQAGTGVVQTMRDATQATLDWLRSPEGNDFLTKVFENLKATTDALKPGVKAVLGGIKDFIEYAAPKMPGIAANFSKFADKMVPILVDIAKDIFDALAWFIEVLSNTPKPVLEALAGVFIAIYALKKFGLLGTVLGSLRTVITTGGIPPWLLPLTALFVAAAAAKSAIESRGNAALEKPESERTGGEKVAILGAQGKWGDWFTEGWAETFRQSKSEFSQMGEWISTTGWPTIVKSYEDKWQAVKDGWNGFWGDIGTATEMQWGTISSWPSKKWAEFETWWDTTSADWGKGWDDFWGGLFGDGGAEGGGSFSNAWGGMGGTASLSWTGLADWWATTSADWGKGWDDFWQGRSDFMGVKWDDIKNWPATKWAELQAWWDTTKEEWKTDWDGFWQWVSDLTGIKWDDIKNWPAKKWAELQSWWTTTKEDWKKDWDAFWQWVADLTGIKWEDIKNWPMKKWTELQNWWQTEKTRWQTEWDKMWTDAEAFISRKWQEIKDNVYKTYLDLKAAVWDPLVNIVSVDIPKAFADAVLAIKTEWDKIMGIVRPPVDWLGNTVYNKGIRLVWNAIATNVGLPSLPEWISPAGFADGGMVGEPKKMAVGGKVSGPGTERSDSVPAMLSKNEFVVQAKYAKPAEHFLHALNSGQTEALRAANAGKRVPYNMRQHLAGGGVAGGQAVLNTMRGRPYIWGGSGSGGTDCSGIVAYVQRGMAGEANPYRRIGTTKSMPWGGWGPGLTSALTSGVNGRGSGASHMVGNLAGTNFEARQTGTPIMVGGGARGPQQFPAQYSLGSAGGQYVGGGAGGGGFFSIPAWVTEGIANATKLLTGYGSAPSAGPFGDMMTAGGLKVAKAAGTTLLDKLNPLNILSGIAGAVGGALGIGGGSARAQIIAAESGGSYTARNPTSSASGRYQMIDSTWRAYRGSSTAAQAWQASPAEQDAAADRYVAARYGGWDQALAFRKTHGWYDEGGIVPPGETSVHNATGKPEALLNNDQWDTISQYVRSTVDNDAVVANTGNMSGNATVEELRKVRQLLEDGAAGGDTVNVNGVGNDPDDTVDAVLYGLRAAKRGRGGRR